MIQGLLSLLTLIPGVLKSVEFITGKFFDSKVAITTAKIGGDVAVARELVVASAKVEATGVDRLNVIAHSRGLMFLVVGFSLPWMAYEWKVVMWDVTLAWIMPSWNHTTDPIGGLVGAWGGVIIASLFGSATVLTAGRMYFGRKS